MAWAPCMILLDIETQSQLRLSTISPRVRGCQYALSAACAVTVFLLPRGEKVAEGRMRGPQRCDPARSRRFLESDPLITKPSRRDTGLRPPLAIVSVVAAAGMSA